MIEFDFYLRRKLNERKNVQNLKVDIESYSKLTNNNIAKNNCLL